MPALSTVAAVALSASTTRGRGEGGAAGFQEISSTSGAARSNRCAVAGTPPVTVTSSPSASTSSRVRTPGAIGTARWLSGEGITASTSTTAGRSSWTTRWRHPSIVDRPIGRPSSVTEVSPGPSGRSGRSSQPGRIGVRRQVRVSVEVSPGVRWASSASATISGGGSSSVDGDKSTSSGAITRVGVASAADTRRYGSIWRGPG